MHPLLSMTASSWLIRPCRRVEFRPRTALDAAVLGARSTTASETQAPYKTPTTFKTCSTLRRRSGRLVGSATV